MTSINTRIWRSGLALAHLCFLAIFYGLTEIAILERVVGHVDRAFWCAAIELVALGPIRLVRYLVDDTRDVENEDGQAGLLQRLYLDIPYYLWTEVFWWKYRRWVQLFVVQGSLSPAPAGTPAVLGDQSSEAAWAQGAAYYLLIQMVANINSILMMVRRAAEGEAAGVLANADPMLGGSGGFLGGLLGRMHYARLAGQALLCRLLFDMFLAVSTHVGRVAFGSWVAACVNAYHAGPASTFLAFTLAFTAVTIFGSVAMMAHTVTVAEEAGWEEEAAARREEEQEERRHADAQRRMELWRERQPEPVGGEERRRAVAAIRARMQRELDEDPAEVEARRQADAREEGLVRETEAAFREANARGGGGDDAEQRVAEIMAGFEAWLALEAAHLLLAPWWPRLLRHRRFLCPELAALWSAHDHRAFLAGVLAGDPASAAVGASLVTLGALRPRDYEELWRAAGLTTDFVLGGGDGLGGGEEEAAAAAAAAAAVGISTTGAGRLLRPLAMVNWGRISWALVSGVEVAFGLCVVAGVVAAVYLKWPGKTRSRKRKRRARV